MGEVGTGEPSIDFYSLSEGNSTAPLHCACRWGFDPARMERERCLCLLHPSQPLHPPAELGICPGDALAQVPHVPSLAAVSQPQPLTPEQLHGTLCTGPCYTPCQTQGASTPDRCWNGTQGFEPKAVPESGEEDVDGVEQCITKHCGDRAGSHSLQLMVGNPCHWAVELAETNPQFQPHLCDLLQSWMKPAEFRLLQAFQGCQAPGQAVFSNSIAAR